MKFYHQGRFGTQLMGGVVMRALGRLFSAGPWLAVGLLVLSVAWSIAKTEGAITEITPNSEGYRFVVETEHGPREATCSGFSCRSMEVGDCVEVERIWDTVRGKCL